MKEKHYRIRRRKERPFLPGLSKRLKIAMTSVGGNRLTRAVSREAVRKELARLGIDVPVRMVEHHRAHAFTALQSGFRRGLVLVMDGVGDGLSASLWHWNGELELLKQWDAGKSIAQFFEFVTYHLGFRELEDEGKVSALATYSPAGRNMLLDFFSIQGLDIIPKYGLVGMFGKLGEIAWKVPRESMASMAQNAIEQWVVSLVRNIMDEYGGRRIGFAGGLFANIRLNMAIREALAGEGVRTFTFPHMGDGGIAAGAALSVENGAGRIEHAYLGPAFLADGERIREIARAVGASANIRETEKPWEDAASAIIDGRYVFWFQGRMEYGPRALGNRSILALPNSMEAKDRLNMEVKRRQWFQPFCPTILWEDSKRILEGVKWREPFMTAGYRVREEWRERMKAVISVDGVARPQMLGSENRPYRKLIEEVKKDVGYGAVLNTSFNIHGEPIVMTPRHAMETVARTGGMLVMGNIVAEVER